MDTKSVLSGKVSFGHAVLIVAILAIPGFFWFRYLYYQFVVLPSSMTPMEAKIESAMKKAHAKPAAPTPPANATTSHTKGDDKERHTQSR